MLNVNLSDILQRLWKKAQEFPLAKELKEPSMYSFVYINSLGERVSCISMSPALHNFAPIQKA